MGVAVCLLNPPPDQVGATIAAADPGPFESVVRADWDWDWDWEIQHGHNTGAIHFARMSGHVYAKIIS